MKLRPELLERERLARAVTDDAAVDRVLGAAQSVGLPRGQAQLRPGVDDVLLPTAKITAGTLRLALREAPIVVVVLVAVFVTGESWQFLDRKSTRLNSSHANISYAVFCLKKKKPTKRV